MPNRDRRLLRPERIAFTTDTFPKEGRFEAFVDHVRAMVGDDYTLTSETPSDFGTTLETQPLGSVVLVNVKKTSHVHTVHEPRPGSSTIVLQVCHWGRICGTHGTAVLDAGAGDAVVMHGDRKGIVDFGAGSRFHSIYVEKERLYPLLKSEVAADGLLLSQSKAEVRLFNAWLLALSSAGVSADPRIMSILEGHTLDLLALALGAQDGAREVAEQRTGRSARLHAILDQIATRSTEPLTAEIVGATLGITERYVRQLLEETGKTFSQHVLERRLQHAHALLTDGKLRGRTVTEISLLAGFNDISYFSREFRKRFKATPSEVQLRGRC